ncbi:MAG: MobC family plasmid mobilization relaxosome protein [Firmicutes bacterium]|nr:MobC family plasmid mobilization relaxosome protein [Bacillota bacterium]
MAAPVRYRPEEFKLRFTKNEKEYFKEKAESVHMNMTAYARKMILDGAIIYRDATVYAKCMYELNAIGKNINQIAHNTNSIGVTTQNDVAQLKQQYERLKELYIQLLGDIT